MVPEVVTLDRANDLAPRMRLGSAARSMLSRARIRGWVPCSSIAHAMATVAMKLSELFGSAIRLIGSAMVDIPIPARQALGPMISRTVCSADRQTSSQRSHSGLVRWERLPLERCPIALLGPSKFPSQSIQGGPDAGLIPT